MRYLYDLLMNFFHFWRRDYYGEPIDASFAWSLAKIHAEHSFEWDAMITVKGGEE